MSSIIIARVRQALEQWRRESRLRWRLRQELDALMIDRPTDMHQICALLTLRRAKPIRLVEYPLKVPGPFALWLGTTSADYILYQKETTWLHQQHSISHELGHVLLDHQSDDTDDAVWQELLPDIPPRIIRRALRRAHYDNEQERDAEVIATLLLETAQARVELSLPVSSDRADRARTALSDRPRWL